MRSLKHIVMGAVLAVSGNVMASELATQETNLFTVTDSVVLFTPGDAGSKFYRIPAICTTNKGTLIAAADRRWNSNADLPGDIDVVVRRSTDGGATWSETITVAGEGTEVGSGDPAVVFDAKRKATLCIFTQGNGLWQSTPDDYCRIMVSKSTDDGRTWTKAMDINDQLFAGKESWVASFAGSGHACQMSNGRILFVIQVRTDLQNWGPLSCYACYSDDGGDTWKVSQNAASTDGDEAKIVELSDGRLMMSIRRRRDGEHRFFSYSEDGGATWSAPQEHEQILDPRCNGDVISYSHKKVKNVLVHTIPFHPSGRKNVSLVMSYDDGATWSVRQTLVPGGSAYSSITQLKDGSLGCFVECDHSSGGYQLVYYHLKPTKQFNRK